MPYGVKELFSKIITLYSSASSYNYFVDSSTLTVFNGCKVRVFLKRSIASNQGFSVIIVYKKLFIT